jgi:hypothetical protein
MHITTVTKEVALAFLGIGGVGRPHARSFLVWLCAFFAAAVCVMHFIIINHRQTTALSNVASSVMCPPLLSCVQAGVHNFS